MLGKTKLLLEEFLAELSLVAFERPATKTSNINHCSLRFST